MAGFIALLGEGITTVVAGCRDGDSVRKCLVVMGRTPDLICVMKVSMMKLGSTYYDDG